MNDCITSAVQQTAPADEIIVVDDGSTDFSDAILQQWHDKVTIVRKVNGGQASAFNAGYQKCSAEIILFLDGDDLLLPQALETILCQWTYDVAALSFGLETIDFAGRSLGLYDKSLWAEDGDNRPKILRNGVFAFAPTSGNAFSRVFLDHVLPMHEERWAISADLYLMMAAALFGRMAALRQVLGRYRIHGGNSYYVTSASPQWQHARGMADMAAAAIGFADSDKLPAADSAEKEQVRLRLRQCGVEILCRRLEFFGAGDAGEIAKEAWRGLPKILRANLPLQLKTAVFLLWFGFALTCRHSKSVRHWMGNAHDRPRYLEWLMAVCGHSHIRAQLASLYRPRWREPLRAGQILGFGHLGMQTNIQAEGWLHEIGDGRAWSKGAEAWLEFTILSPPAPILVCVGVETATYLRDRPIRFRASFNDTELWNGDITNDDTIAMDIPLNLIPKDGICRIKITSATYDRLRDALFTPSPFFSLQYVTMRPSQEEHELPFLTTGQMHRFARYVPRDPEKHGWITEPPGTMVEMDSPDADLTLSFNQTGPQLELRLELPPQEARGTLRIVSQDTLLFAGRGPFPVQLRLRLPENDHIGPQILKIDFTYTAGDALDIEALKFSQIGIYALRETPLTLPYHAQTLNPFPPLALGQTIAFDGGTLAEIWLDDGWRAPDPTGVRLNQSEATLIFNVQQNAMQRSLDLELEPSLEILPTRRHLFAVSGGDAILTAAYLEGPGHVSVPLPEAAVAENGDVSLTLHSVFEQIEETTPDVDTPAFAPLLLRAMTLRGESTPRLPPVQRDAQPDPTWEPQIISALSAVAQLCEASPRAENLHQLDSIRTGIVRKLWSGDVRLHRHIASSAKLYTALVELGYHTSGAPFSATEQEIVDAIRNTVGEKAGQDDRLRYFLCAVVLLPSYQLPQQVNLHTLPSPLLWQFEVTARYLAQERFELRQPEALNAYYHYVCRLLKDVHQTLGTVRPNGLYYDLAVAVLTYLNPKGLLFGPDNLRHFAELRGRCIERHLSRSGCMLAAAPPGERADGGLIRLGVLVRGLEPCPEAWLLMGMFRHLDRSTFAPVLITMTEMNTPSRYAELFPESISIAHLPVEEAVDKIRGLSLDIFVLGAFFFEFETLSAIVAHRLARRQVLCTAISATTSGLRSFDYVLAHRSVEPVDADTHYSEKIIFYDAAFQNFDFFDSEITRELPSAYSLRQRHGLNENQVIFISGAMMLKINQELIACWMDVLTQVPDSVLVLYPHAKNWEMPYPTYRFDSLLRTHAENKKVDPDRIIILDGLPVHDVRAILSEADLYLDSFPYSGATTVVEALLSEVPVVALSGETQRAKQGAYWLEQFGLTDWIADSKEDYCNIASTMALDPERRKKVQNSLRNIVENGKPSCFPCAEFGRQFSEALQKTLSDAGSLPCQGKPPRPGGDTQ